MIKQHPNLNFNNKGYIEPDQLVISKLGRQKQAKMLDVKTGYEDGSIDLDQLDNYLKLMDNAQLFSSDFGGASKISLEYLFLPGKKGGNAKSAAEKAKGDILEFIKTNTSLNKDQKKKIVKSLDIKYVGEDGILNVL